MVPTDQFQNLSCVSCTRFLVRRNYFRFRKLLHSKSARPPKITERVRITAANARKTGTGQFLAHQSNADDNPSMLTLDATIPSSSIHPVVLADYERHILDLGVLAEMPRVTDFLPNTKDPDTAIQKMWDYLDTRVRNHVRMPSPLGRPAPAAPMAQTDPSADPSALPTAVAFPVSSGSNFSSTPSIPSLNTFIPHNALSSLYYQHQTPLGRRQRHSKERKNDCALTMGLLLANAPGPNGIDGLAGF